MLQCIKHVHNCDSIQIFDSDIFSYIFAFFRIFFYTFKYFFSLSFLHLLLTDIGHFRSLDVAYIKLQ